MPKQEDKRRPLAEQQVSFGGDEAEAPGLNPFAEDNPFHAPRDTATEVEAVLREHYRTQNGGTSGRLADVPLDEPAAQPAPTAAARTTPPGASSPRDASNPFINGSSFVPAPFVPSVGGDVFGGQGSNSTPWGRATSLRTSYEAATPPGGQPSSLSTEAAGAWEDSASKGGVPVFEAALPPPDSRKKEGAEKKGGAMGRLWSHKAPPADAGAAAVPPPWLASAGRGSDAGGGLERDLQRREQEVARREAELSRREAALRQAGTSGSGARPKNWPALRCVPKLVHHDIGGEVPAQRQHLVRAGYVAWCIICAANLYNWVIITFMFIFGVKGMSLWLMASLVAGFGVPLSFICWYRGLYFAAIKDSGPRWFWFFAHMAANVVWCWWMFVGIKPNLGGYSAGLFTMIDEFKAGGGKGTAFGILSLVNVALWAAGGILSMGVWGGSMGVFRSAPLPATVPPSARSRGGRLANVSTV